MRAIGLWILAGVLSMASAFAGDYPAPQLG